ncbi:Hypothetical_protein [Hexamita inflata]|uniref:Hypothetical_protein n=1 Tax=Hexamita inflata TaxID=28002 RepID=A0ABP1H8S4_9EUKA
MQYILECYKYYRLYQVDDHFTVDLVASKKCRYPDSAYPFELLVNNKQYTIKFTENAFLTFTNQRLEISCVNAENHESCESEIQTPFSSSQLFVNGEILESYNKYRSDIVVFWVIVGVAIVVLLACLVYCLRINKPTKQNKIVIQLPEESQSLLAQQ